MSIVLTQHEEGCVPFRRCRACDIADIISATCVKEVLEIFSPESIGPQFQPGIHLPGCSPINPCFNCDSVALLKKVLPEGRFNLLLALMDESKPLEVHQREQDPSYARMKSLLMKPVSELELSARSANCLKDENIVYVGDLCLKTEAEMLRISNFGRKSLDEIKEVLVSMRLRFGMEFLPDIYQSTT